MTEGADFDSDVSDGRTALSRLGLGVVLILLAVVVFAGSRWVAGRQRHAYDPGATPPSTYLVTADRTYWLSSGESVKQLLATGVLTTLSCIWSADGQMDNTLPVTGKLDDERNRHEFASFTAPVTGSIHITCADIATVFVDDADDSAPDWAAVLMIVTMLLGLGGATLTVSGGYRLMAFV